MYDKSIGNNNIIQNRIYKRRLTSLPQWLSLLPLNWPVEKRRYFTKRICQRKKINCKRPRSNGNVTGVGADHRGLQPPRSHFQQVFVALSHLRNFVKLLYSGKNVQECSITQNNKIFQTSVEELQGVEGPASGWQNTTWQGADLNHFYFNMTKTRQSWTTLTSCEDPGTGRTIRNLLPWTLPSRSVQDFTLKILTRRSWSCTLPRTRRMPTRWTILSRWLGGGREGGLLLKTTARFPYL